MFTMFLMIPDLCPSERLMGIMPSEQFFAAGVSSPSGYDHSWPKLRGLGARVIKGDPFTDITGCCSCGVPNSGRRCVLTLLPALRTPFLLLGHLMEPPCEGLRPVFL